MYILKVWPLVAVTSGILLCAQTAPVDGFGAFAGVLQFEPAGDGVHMKVLQRYSYTDAQRHTLTADPGFVTDGASIPRALWSIVGSPFTGQYIGAAVIHDVGCDTHKYPWEVTHRMFYTAMRALGVSDDYAKLLYWGVRVGGPRWEETSTDYTASARKGKKGLAPTSTITLPARSLSGNDAAAILQYIRRRAPSEAGSVSLDEIDRRTPLEGPLPATAIPQQ